MDFWYVTSFLWEGFQKTLLIFGLTLLFALPLGLVVSFGTMSRLAPLRNFVKTVIWMVRGTPLMLQVMIFFYGPNLLFGLRITNEYRFYAVIIAFTINYACYFSEIYRGGIESISKSQYEAGQVLGMTKPQIFFRVILLQVVKRITAPMSNEIITLVKDTALARIVMYVEIIRQAEFLAARGFYWPLFYTGAFYLVFIGILTLLFGYIERRLSYFRA